MKYSGRRVAYVFTIDTLQIKTSLFLKKDDLKFNDYIITRHCCYLYQQKGQSLLKSEILISDSDIADNGQWLHPSYLQL